jgi:hypothetical protein
MSHADTASDDGSTDGGSGLRPTLLSAYREYVGTPDEEREVYAGFGLFFAGAALGLVGFALFLFSGTQTPETSAFWTLREISLVTGLLGLPAMVVSIVVLLPVGRRTRVAAGLGTALCVVALGVLVATYPYDWTTASGVSGSVLTITIYAAGLVALSAATGSALIAQYLDRAAAASTAGTAADGETGEGDGEETIDDETVREDIEAAMDDSTLSWGGVEQNLETKRLELNTGDEELEVDPSMREATDEMTRRSESDSVDDAVSQLRGLQGGESDTASGSSTDDQVAALTEFREEKAAEAEDEPGVETGVEEDRGLLARLRAWLSG